MAHRIGRLAHVVRDVVSDSIRNHVGDPRVQPFTSVTRVELSVDLRQADVYISVMGTEAEERMTMQGLHSARGMIQTRLAKELNIRQCPIIRFCLDKGLKAAMETFRQLKEIGPLPDESQKTTSGESSREGNDPGSDDESPSTT